MSDEFDAYDLSEFTEEDFIAIDADLARAHARPAVEMVVEGEDSPFDKFLSWKKHLAVTDLVAPLWCEVQYEYSLYGQRHKPLHLRPSAFTSKSGKRIRVQQPVAHANDRRLKRGKSVHRALEDELCPEKRVVQIVSEEERFGLRLLQLIDGFKQLVSDGITRELPVFAITHAQVVLGVIDEVLRLPLTRPNQDEATSGRSPPSTPSGSPPNKKKRLVSPASMNADHEAEPTNPEHLYELHIVDYKTRRSPIIPLDEDSLSPRLQLMMYHRMLSSVLEPEVFDFDQLWTRLSLDPTKPFSPQFLKDVLWENRQADPEDCNVHLGRLVSEWISTVQRNRTRLTGVSRQLQIVYRRSVYARRQRARQKRRTPEAVDLNDPLEALVLQEELDLARAIEKSLSEMEHQASDRHVVQKEIEPLSVGSTPAMWKDVMSLSDPGQADSALAWAIQESLLDCAQRAHAQSSANETRQADATHDGPPFDETRPVVTAPKEQVQGETILNISPIIGKKEFMMSDEELDGHLADVLQWWFGARAARGVEIGQTNRCFSCEYRDSCEWRERRARETAGKDRDTESRAYSMM